ncbi:unnamed protein product [Pleuronectes platessa]|uniref:Uncharacterized protein n=1 Tax=Pleuronectes platessa TaxID=8262 RepID=A0A9N7VGW5_PLEPL|nr:unnamed protein product [Pleuronectes platessa]
MFSHLSPDLRKDVMPLQDPALVPMRSAGPDRLGMQKHRLSTAGPRVSGRNMCRVHIFSQCPCQLRFTGPPPVKQEGAASSPFPGSQRGSRPHEGADHTRPRVVF